MLANPSATQVAAEPKIERYIGLMSGTSVDGVDAVLAESVEGQFRSVVHVAKPFSPTLRAALQSLMASGADEIERAGDASVALAETYGRAVHGVLLRAGVQASEIRAIGVHGQTVRHRPERGFTVQLNQPALLAERTGIPVVADFRSRDVAAGGQGAPLVPAFHAAMFSGDETRVVLNIGGIGNVSVLPARGSQHDVAGYDTGPGNTLMDGWCETHQGKPFDKNGAWAAQGLVNSELLTLLLEEPYLRVKPPKSTGRELFNMAWLSSKLTAITANIPPVDVQATLLAYTVETLVIAVRAAGAKQVFVCGGGALNGALMTALKTRVGDDIAVASTAALGIDPQQVEALAFAWLARQCLLGLPGNLPAVTGAHGLRVLGAVYPI